MERQTGDPSVWGDSNFLRTAGETCFASLVLPLVEILKSNEIQKTLAPCREGQQGKVRVIRRNDPESSKENVLF